MRLTTIGLIAVAALSLATTGTRAQSVDDDGCWSAEGTHASCVSHSAEWETPQYGGDIFVVHYTNKCSMRVYLKACIRTQDGRPPEQQCAYGWLDPGQGEIHRAGSQHEPSGEYAFQWIGSTIVGLDPVCANKSGQTEWLPEW